MMQPPQTERELPMLAGIAGFFRWFEELLNILNGPLLMFGAGIALVDLLTDGALTATDQALLFAWAISQALGIDLQLLACFARARLALLRQHYWALLGWLILGVPLAIATWQAGYVYAVQQSEHISEAAALAEVGMDRRAWLAWRLALAVGLVALAGWTRYVAPRLSIDVAAAEARAKLEAELMLEPLRAQKRALQARGVRSVADALRGKEMKEMPATAAPVQPQKLSAAPPDHSRPPTGPGTPVTAHTPQPASEPIESAFPGVIDETGDYDDERESSRVTYIGRSRSAKRANKRMRREQRDARRDLVRDAVYAVLDQAVARGERLNTISMRELVRRVNTSDRLATDLKTSAATVKHHVVSWQRDHPQHQQHQQAVR